MAKTNGFQVYIAEIKSDPDLCFRNSVHKRSLEDIRELHTNWDSTPPNYISLDLRGIMQDSAIDEVLFRYR